VSTQLKDFSILEKDLCFVDVETTGVVFGFHEVIEVGAIRTTPDANTILAKFNKRMRPNFPERMSARAQEVNGFLATEWEHSSEHAEDVWSEFSKFANNCVPVAHNPGFDRSFVTLGAASVGIARLGLDYHWIGTESLAWPLFVNRDIADLSLDGICEHFLIPKEPRPHRAINGAESCRAAYLALMKIHLSLKRE
jgi:DNA polymerase III alpha subunit (gram-positive type)